MDILSRLFGSQLRVRLMRLFLFNPEGSFDIEYISARTAEKPKIIEKEISFLRTVGFIKPSKLSKVVLVKKGRSVIQKKVTVKAWSLDKKFAFANALEDFLVRTHSLERKSILKKLERAGRIKAVLIAGIFIRNIESRLDLFVVGDNIKSASMDRIIKGIEADMGKDIRYAVLSASDFAYRVSVNDKLVRDILDFPHEVLVDKIGISKA